MLETQINSFVKPMVTVLNKPPPRRKKPVVGKRYVLSGTDVKNKVKKTKKQKSPLRPAEQSMTTYLRAPANANTTNSWKKKPNRKPKMVSHHGKGPAMSRANASKNTTNTRNARKHRPGKGEHAKFRTLFEELGIESKLVAKKTPLVVHVAAPQPPKNARAAAIALLRTTRRLNSPSR